MYIKSHKPFHEKSIEGTPGVLSDVLLLTPTHGCVSFV